MNSTAVLNNLRAICGETNVLGEGDAKDNYLHDFLRQRQGRALAVVKPQSTLEVSQVIRLCAQSKTPVVPQGGNTGYRGGCIPDASGRALVLSMERMRGPPDIYPAGYFMIAQAGCILQELQQAAEDAGLFFPLDLGAKSACQIGGNLATNAGGLNFLRYGGAREMCLGLEAVLPSGDIVNLLSGARKDNSGFDIKNLLIGSEGALAVITAASLKLFPRPSQRAAAYAAINSVEDALEILAICQAKTGGMMESFELISESLFQLLAKHFPEEAQPFPSSVTMAVLAEVAGPEGASEQLQDALAEAMEKKLATDVVFAASETQRRKFWRLRELTPEATKRAGPWIKMDVALPPHNIAAFLSAAQDISDAENSESIIGFGHLGDGNLHLSVRPHKRAPEDNPQLAAALKARFLQLALQYGGSFSAEHGIGKTSAADLQKYKDPAALSLMRKIKQSLDPDNIMNPGSVLTAE